MPTFILFLLSLVLCPLEGAYFKKPPSGWVCVEDASQLPAKVLALYTGKGSTRFAPTIHVASDPLNQPLEAYIEQAKAYHNRNIGATCVDMGQIMTPEGMARLIQINCTSVYGNVSLLQAYLNCNQKAYVITGISLKDDFKGFSPLFYETVQTFDLASENQSH